jgi:hypothetical protein
MLELLNHLFDQIPNYYQYVLVDYKYLINLHQEDLYLINLFRKDLQMKNLYLYTLVGIIILSLKLRAQEVQITSYPPALIPNAS